MHRAEKIIADIQKENGLAVLLLFGDDFRVQELTRSLLDAIVPEDQRAFNLERFDGRTAAWEKIETSLATPPFFPGRKVVWVENTPYFMSREQKTELSAKVFQYWAGGKKEEAGKLLMDLLSVAGWSNDQWQELLSGGSLGPLLSLLGAGNAEEIEPLIAYCQMRELSVTGGALASGHGLSKVLDGGIPPWSFLLLTAIQVDRRSRLYRRFEEIGAALYLGLERDRTGRLGRDTLLEFINQRLAHAGKTMGAREREMVVLRAGDDLRTLQQELEKLFLYVGERPSIRVSDIEAILMDQAQGWIFDLTRALSDGHVTVALSHLARLLAEGEHPLKLLATMAGEMRKLLAARQLLDTELKGSWRHGMSYQQFQQALMRHGSAPLSGNLYAEYMCFQRAETFSAHALRSCLAQIYDTDLRLKSSGNQPQILMERLILTICLRARSDRQPPEIRRQT